eukprot:TRINITY_DN2082_c0_g1_i2.p1 TRINITY_DN2082_c0_g1~~TRINITY_DN2082_c0_g1_i2.p1  ORF type:complete len:358 (-),score=64.18 TRINITY_DN2082_c0_g1_i2:442-1515(-)
MRVHASVAAVAAAVLVVVAAAAACARAQEEIVCSPAVGTPVNEPAGVAKGINPGRVVWFHDAEVCTWDGNPDTNWWQEGNTDQTTVDKMLAKTLQTLTGDATTAAAWQSLFKYFNKEHKGSNTGYTAGQKIAVKINLNTDWPDYNKTYANNNGNSLSPQFLKALLRTLTSDAGVKQADISVYDAARILVPYLYDAPEGSHDEFPGVHYVDNQGLHGRELVVPDPNTRFYFSNSTIIANADKTQLPTCATKADYMIVVDNFRGHDVAGVTLTGKNWFGSINRPCCPDPYCGKMIGWGFFFFRNRMHSRCSQVKLASAVRRASGVRPHSMEQSTSLARPWAPILRWSTCWATTSLRAMQ